MCQIPARFGLLTQLFEKRHQRMNRLAGRLSLFVREVNFDNRNFNFHVGSGLETRGLRLEGVSMRPVIVFNGKVVLEVGLRLEGISMRSVVVNWNVVLELESLKPQVASLLPRCAVRFRGRCRLRILLCLNLCGNAQWRCLRDE